MNSLQHDPVRQAALALHAVGPADREWLLGSLPSGQRAQLRLLLEELRNIGIPQDRRLLNELCAGCGELLADSSAQRSSLDIVQGTGLATLAGSEPPVIIAGLCCAAGAQSRHRLLASLSPVLRAEVERHEARMIRAPALRAAILDAVRRLCAARDMQAQRVRSSWWQAFRTRLQMLRRAG